MATMIATGLGACCCPDCLMFSESFDCCIHSVPRCDRIPCCINTVTWETIPSRNIGGKWAWEKATGEWWKAISPNARYTFIGGAPCNDGALWEVSGSGTITSAIGFPNTGFRLVFTVLTPMVGTDLTVHAWSSIDDPASGFKARFRFLKEDGVEAIRIEACDKSLTIKTPFRRRTIFSITYVHGKYVGVAYGVDPDTSPNIVCCGISLSGGWKFSFSNNSGSDEHGPIPLILDDVAVYKELVYYRQPETSWRCFDVGCRCKSEKTKRNRYEMPGKLTLKMYVRCRLPYGGGHVEHWFEWTLNKKPQLCNTWGDIDTVTWESDTLYCPRENRPLEGTYWRVWCGRTRFFLGFVSGNVMNTHELNWTNCDPLVFERVSMSVPPSSPAMQEFLTYLNRCVCDTAWGMEVQIDIYE